MALPKDIISCYLHPDYVDNRSDKIYSNNRCPLSMLAETCNSIGKILTDNRCSPSQDSNFPISPSCGSSCSAPKFSPHSLDLSPLDPSKLKDCIPNEKRSKEKSRKRKLIAPDFNHKGMPPEQKVPTATPYSISDFLKVNIFPPNALGIQDQHAFSRLAQRLQSSPPSRHHAGFQNQNYHASPAEAPQMLSPSQTHLIKELHNLYNSCQREKHSCDCVACFHQKNMDQNPFKVDQSFFDSLKCIRLQRPTKSSIVPNLGVTNSGSSIQYCMYCGEYIPEFQNLMKHIQCEHFDQISSNFQSESAVLGNLRLAEVQSSAQKSREILKQLYMLYNSDDVDELIGGDTKLLIR